MMDTKTPLHDAALEKSVISTIIQYNDALPDIQTILRPDCFYDRKYRAMYDAIIFLDSKREPINHTTLKMELERTSKLEDAGGVYEVVKCTDVVYNNAVLSYAAKLYNYYALRQMVKISMELYNRCHEPNAEPIEIMQSAGRELSNIDFINKTNVEILGDVVAQVLEENRTAIETGIKPGIGTGFNKIDKYHKKQKQELGIIGARPGMGKTAFMLACARHTGIELKKPVAIFSLEMSTKKLVGRMMGAESQVSTKDINQKNLTSSKLMHVGASISKLLDAPVYFDDAPFLDITTLRIKLRKMIEKFGIEECYIDYLQLMSGEKKGNREQEISYISRNLKLLAKEFDLPITALSQLGRTVETRPDRMPILSDLRESGSIEQDADWVMFLMRPEYYGLGNEHNGLYENQTFDSQHLLTENLLIVDCAKYREGSLFTSALKFFGEFMLISDYGTQLTVSQAEAINTKLENNNDFLS